jgi:hypothetical protein
MIKFFGRWLLAILLIATPVLGLSEYATANTELVPASRLVFPYWDISGSRSTLLLLTNASSVHDANVHLEFYDKTCTRHNRQDYLSEGDIDQLDLKVNPNLTGNPNLPSGLGWVDLDVRESPGQSTDESIQLNVLMGNAVLSDAAGNFAVAYPAASIIGSSANGHRGDIVTHDTNGSAVTWTGRYEPLPQRVFVPAFFAEGGPLGQTSTLAIAAPADGNYAGGVAGESPGQHLPGSGPAKLLMSGTAYFFDACEVSISQPLESHYIFGSLTSLFGATLANQSSWNNPTTGTSCGAFPSTDRDNNSSAFVGWIDFENTLDTSFATGTNEPVVADREAARGMVGVLVQNVVTSITQGDAFRLWGDPSVLNEALTRENYSLVNEAGLYSGILYEIDF